VSGCVLIASPFALVMGRELRCAHDQTTGRCAFSRDQALAGSGSCLNLDIDFAHRESAGLENLPARANVLAAEARFLGEDPPLQTSVFGP